MPATAAPAPSATTASRARSDVGVVRAASPRAYAGVAVDRGDRARRSARRCPCAPAPRRSPPAARDTTRRSRAPAAPARPRRARRRRSRRACEMSIAVIGVTAPASAASARPDAEALEDQPRAVRQRERAVAAQRRARCRARRARRRRGRRRRAPAPASPPTGPAPTMTTSCIACPGDRASTRCAQAASTSATVFGVAAVRFSWPLAVTSTSSSMRTPMFQKCFGHVVGGADVGARLDGEHHARRPASATRPSPGRGRRRARPCRASGRRGACRTA